MVDWFDSTILQGFQSIHTPILTFVMRIFTFLGEAGILWIVMGLFLLIRKKTRKVGAMVLLSLIFCLLTGNIFLKNVVARPRPCWRNPQMEMLIRIPTDYSFPSGHTMASVAAAMSIFLENKKWGIPALLTAAVIAASRMYFYVHYPTDILAGALLGILLAVLARWLMEKVIKIPVKVETRES